MAVEQTWLGDLVASAIATGDCGLATLDLVVHNGVDEVVWSASYGSADLLGFDDILEPDAMRFAMEDWLLTTHVPGHCRNGRTAWTSPMRANFRFMWRRDCLSGIIRSFAPAIIRWSATSRDAKALCALSSIPASAH